MNKATIERIILAQGVKLRISGEYAYAIQVSPFSWRKGAGSRCLGRMSGVERLNEEQLRQYVSIRFH
jgi:hypothetical protein